MNNIVVNTISAEGLTPVDWNVMSYLDLSGSGFGLSKAVTVSQEEESHHRFTLEQCQASIEKLLSLKFLKTLDQHDCECDLDFRNAELLPSMPLDGYLPGQIDLTPMGYQLYRGLLKRAIPEVGLAPQFAIFDNNQDLATILSESKERCTSLSHELLSNPEAYLDGLRPLWATLPANIGPWRRTRFEVLAVGYRVLIQLAV